MPNEIVAPIEGVKAVDHHHDGRQIDHHPAQIALGEERGEKPQPQQRRDGAQTEDQHHEGLLQLLRSPRNCASSLYREHPR